MLLAASETLEWGVDVPKYAMDAANKTMTYHKDIGILAGLSERGAYPLASTGDHDNAMEVLRILNNAFLVLYSFYWLSSDMLVCDCPSNSGCAGLIFFLYYVSDMRDQLQVQLRFIKNQTLSANVYDAIKYLDDVLSTLQPAIRDNPCEQKYYDDFEELKRHRGL